ncbi:MAG: hypothetical protein LBD75_03275 [Candidatus Peribacteria bacterium]|nr:hypothetical protein [Candidatus Peribacteria bacterium]
MAVFPECKTLYTKTEYVSVGKVNYPREVPDLVEIGWRAKQYASCSKVKTVC